jgi:glycopeptide antibiotics resistance protein
MLIQNHALRIFFWIVFIAYMLLLTKNILFKKTPSYYKNDFRNEYRHYSIKQGWEKANTKPFSTIKLFYNSHRLNPEYRQNNLWGNLLGFLPLGVLLPLLIAFFRKGIIVLFTGFAISLCFEMTQLLFDLGVFDVDDIILNTAGCLCGYIIFSVMVRIFIRQHTHSIVTDTRKPV